MKITLVRALLTALVLAGGLLAPRETISQTSPIASAAPVLKPEAVAHPYYRGLIAEVQPLGPRVLMLGADPDTVLSAFNLASIDAGKATAETVPVEGMPFHKAIRISTEKKKAEWQTLIQAFLPDQPLKKGDVLYVTAWVRALSVADGRANGGGRIYFDQKPAMGDATGVYNGDFSIPHQWTRLHIPVVAARDTVPGDTLKLMFTFGQVGQTVEFGGVAAINFGPGLDIKRLPHATLALDYSGRAPDAAWRKAAEARIEKIRKAPLRVQVVDASGKPVRGATVRIEMTRHAFIFGSSLPIGMLPGQNVKPYNADFQRTAGASEADKKRLQREFLRLFNAACTSVTWIIWEGGDSRIARSDILAGLKWLHENNIACLDSQCVYPGQEFTPTQVQPLLTKDRAAEFGEAVRRYIEFCARELPVDSLQIANEIEGRPGYTDVLGYDAVPQWFRWAKAANPKKLVMINGPYQLGDAVIQTENRGGAWPHASGLQYYYDLIRWLQKRQTPLDYIGIQNHAGIGAPGPEAVLKTLDQLATLGLPIQVTEFEVTLQDGSDPKQRAYQADYVRDYFTAVFSHPAARGIILQDFWQPGAWQYEGASCFFNADWSLNPHGKVYADLVLNRWWTREKKTTDASGACQARGFLGDYRVTVTTADGRARTVTARLPSGGARVQVVLP